MKKVMLLSVFFLFLGLVPHVFAEGFVPLAPIPGLTQGVTANTEGLANFFNNLYKYLIGLAAALAVIQIIWGGLEIAVNKDNVSKITDSKGKIYNAIFGLVLVLSPVLVFSIINPSILNLSLNLPKLDTRTGTPVQTTQPPCNSVRTTNCVQQAPTQEGTAATASPGLYCFERSNPSPAANDFVCASTQVLCERDYNLYTGPSNYAATTGSSPVSSCRLTPP